MTYLLQVVVGFLMICMAFGPQSLWASFGPCAFNENIIPHTVENITCVRGICEGSVDVYPNQTICLNVDENPCAQSNHGVSCRSYYLKTTTNVTVDMLLEMGIPVATAVCLIGVCMETGWVGLVAEQGIELACGAAAVLLFSQIDPCWFTTCERDWGRQPSTLYEGTDCQ